MNLKSLCTLNADCRNILGNIMEYNQKTILQSYSTITILLYFSSAYEMVIK